MRKLLCKSLSDPKTTKSLADPSCEEDIPAKFLVKQQFFCKIVA